MRCFFSPHDLWPRIWIYADTGLTKRLASIHFCCCCYCCQIHRKCVFVFCKFLLGYASIVENGIPVNAASVNPCAYARTMLSRCSRHTVNKSKLYINTDFYKGHKCWIFYWFWCMFCYLCVFFFSATLLSIQQQNKMKREKKNQTNERRASRLTHIAYRTQITYRNQIWHHTHRH